MHVGFLSLRCQKLARNKSFGITRTRLAVVGQSSIPEDVKSARKVKRQGLIISTLFVGAALVVSHANGVRLPEEVLRFAAVGSAGLLLLALIIKAVAGDALLIEFHDGALYVQLGVPTEGGPNLEADSVEVRQAGARGNGAFALRSIPKGTYLGDYEGELLDEEQYWHRYPDGVADYCIGIDRKWTIDGRVRAMDTSKFSACHMNHSSKRQNVSRRCARADRRVSFYTSRDIQVDEELLLDYGKIYWSGRENEVID